MSRYDVDPYVGLLQVKIARRGRLPATRVQGEHGSQWERYGEQPYVGPPRAWAVRAACQSAPDDEAAWFFPPTGNLIDRGRGEVAFVASNADTAVAKYCNLCSVREECLAYAEAMNPDMGLFGGVDFGRRRFEQMRAVRAARAAKGGRP